jgi:hypothetical protein
MTDLQKSLRELRDVIRDGQPDNRLLLVLAALEDVEKRLTKLEGNRVRPRSHMIAEE